MSTCKKFVDLLPEHKCELVITHNPHTGCYMSVREYMENIEIEDDDFISIEEKNKCMESDEMWCVQWYPQTPIGSISVYGHSLESIIKYINE